MRKMRKDYPHTDTVYVKVENLKTPTLLSKRERAPQIPPVTPVNWESLEICRELPRRKTNLKST
jgi:hypothetical protein